MVIFLLISFLVRFLYIPLYFQAVSRVYLSIYYSHLLFCLFWGWIRGNFSGGPGRIFRLCEAPLCGVSGRYDLFECWPGVGGGAVRVFLFLGSVEVGTVRLK